MCASAGVSVGGCCLLPHGLEHALPFCSRSPVQVLVISLVFIAFVVLLHVYGKIRGSVTMEEE